MPTQNRKSFQKSSTSQKGRIRSTKTKKETDSKKKNLKEEIKYDIMDELLEILDDIIDEKARDRVEWIKQKNARLEMGWNEKEDRYDLFYIFREENPEKIGTIDKHLFHVELFRDDDPEDSQYFELATFGNLYLTRKMIGERNKNLGGIAQILGSDYQEFGNIHSTPENIQRIIRRSGLDFEMERIKKILRETKQTTKQLNAYIKDLKQYGIEQALKGRVLYDTKHFANIFTDYLEDKLKKAGIVIDRIESKPESINVDFIIYAKTPSDISKINEVLELETKYGSKHFNIDVRFKEKKSDGVLDTPGLNYVL